MQVTFSKVRMYKQFQCSRTTSALKVAHLPVVRLKPNRSALRSGAIQPPNAVAVNSNIRGADAEGAEPDHPGVHVAAAGQVEVRLELVWVVYRGFVDNTAGIVEEGGALTARQEGPVCEVKNEPAAAAGRMMGAAVAVNVEGSLALLDAKRGFVRDD